MVVIPFEDVYESVKALMGRYGWSTSFVAALDPDLCGKIEPSTIASVSSMLAPRLTTKGALIRFGTGDDTALELLDMLITAIKLTGVFEVERCGGVG